MHNADPGVWLLGFTLTPIWLGSGLSIYLCPALFIFMLSSHILCLLGFDCHIFLSDIAQSRQQPEMHGHAPPSCNSQGWFLP